MMGGGRCAKHCEKFFEARRRLCVTESTAFVETPQRLGGARAILPHCAILNSRQIRFPCYSAICCPVPFHVSLPVPLIGSKRRLSGVLRSTCNDFSIRQVSEER